MSIRIIAKEPDSILRQKSKTVTKFNKHLHKLLDDMAETMYDANGVGLAAPQVSILKKAIVLDSREEDGPGLIEVINPEIVSTKGSQVGPEGCLSIPGLNGDVKRHQYVHVKGQDRHGEPIEFHAEDFLARIFQHEIDHLNGVLFTDIADSVYKIEPEEEVD